MQKNKKEIRQKFIETRNSIKGRTIEEKKIYSNLNKLINCSGPLVSLYYPTRSEVSLIKYAMEMQNKDIKIALPVIIKKESHLVFRLWRKKETLKEDKYKIFIPDNFIYVEPKILLVPMVAFDKEKNRLGYGGGYYDRTITFLEKNNKILTIGVAFDQQEAKYIPSMNFDKKMDVIVTQSRIII